MEEDKQAVKTAWSEIQDWSKKCEKGHRTYGNETCDKCEEAARYAERMAVAKTELVIQAKNSDAYVKHTEEFSQHLKEWSRLVEAQNKIFERIAVALERREEANG